MSFFLLPLTQILACLTCGIILNVLYLTLLWLTIKFLPRTSHKGLCLFFSVLVRLALFLGLALVFSQQNPERFIWIVFGFILTRFIVVGYVQAKGAK